MNNNITVFFWWYECYRVRVAFNIIDDFCEGILYCTIVKLFHLHVTNRLEFTVIRNLAQEVIREAVDNCSSLMINILVDILGQISSFGNLRIVFQENICVGNPFVNTIVFYKRWICILHFNLVNRLTTFRWQVRSVQLEVVNSANFNRLAVQRVLIFQTIFNCRYNIFLRIDLRNIVRYDIGFCNTGKVNLISLVFVLARFLDIFLHSCWEDQFQVDTLQGIVIRVGYWIIRSCYRKLTINCQALSLDIILNLLWSFCNRLVNLSREAADNLAIFCRHTNSIQIWCYKLVIVFLNYHQAGLFVLVNQTCCALVLVVVNVNCVNLCWTSQHRLTINIFTLSIGT